MRSLLTALSLLSIAFASCAHPGWRDAEVHDSWLAHDVYFDLKDDSEEACNAFIEACWTQLADIEGIGFFASGTRVESLDRDVNDLDYDVSLHVFFENKAAHDAYQTDPRHLALIEKFADAWDSVRVFDSFVEARYLR